MWVGVYDNPGGPNGATANDGKRFVRSEIVNRGSSAPNLLGVFNDKTAIEADRTGGTCDGTVYFAWSRFTGNGTQQHLHLALDRPRRDVVESEEHQPGRPGRPVRGHLDHRQRSRLRDLPPVGAQERAGRCGRHREVDRLRRDLRRGQGPAGIHAVRRAAMPPIRRPTPARRRVRRAVRRRGLPPAEARATAATSTDTASRVTRSSAATRRSARPRIRPTRRTSGSTSSTTRASPGPRSRPGPRTGPSPRRRQPVGRLLRAL